jgi:LysM repeat protein
MTINPCQSGVRSYYIKAGDTIYLIAQRFGISTAAIMNINPGLNVYNLQIGQRICIPCPLNTIPYTIQPGDTFYLLSQTIGLSPSELLRVNPGINPTNLQVGQTICLPYRKKPKWAGVRESVYGVEQVAHIPFPNPQGWANAMNHMASHWPGSSPTAIWLVSEVQYDTVPKGITTLQFSSPGGNYDSLIDFNPNIIDHEAYLSFFDSQGIKIFPQIEPGYASVPDQIDAVLRKFVHHSCVQGFAIDVEFFGVASQNEKNDMVSDTLAQQWETQVKSYNSKYQLLLKHFNVTSLPPHYRNDIIFCCDSQNHADMNDFLRTHKKMADFCGSNPIIYQIGYDSDAKWWKSLSNDPPKTLGDALIAQTEPDRDYGVIWIDFTLNLNYLPL